MRENSFKIGESFENYVVTTLFKVHEYDLIHRTNNYEQNKNRFSEDTLKPDFKFRCKKTQAEFYVEAKFRTNFNYDNKLEIMSFSQKDRFLRIQNEENIPVYILIGYEGYPTKPKNLSFVPLNELIYLELYPSFLKKFEIHNKSINNDFLELNKSNSKKEYSFLINKILSKGKTKVYLFIALFFSVLAVSMLFYNSNDMEDQIKSKTKQYYSTVEIGDVENLKNYINPKVNQWYNHYNITFEEVKKITYDYLKKYPKSKTEIRWDTFKVEEINGDYLATYKLIYQIKTKGKFYNKIYHLDIQALWDKNLKLKSILEQKG